MILVHHAGKMGDLIYCLPVLRALHRTTGERIHLTTSGLCYQLGPLLEEQSYIAEVVVDDTRPYKLTNGETTNWEFYAPGEGLNLSLQPTMFRPEAPIPWTLAYAEVAGVTLEPADYVAFPSLVNHRRWFQAHQVSFDGVPSRQTPTAIIAPDGETMTSAHWMIWRDLINALSPQYTVFLVGKTKSMSFDNARDLLGLTTVSTMARLIAEATLFIGAHSAPWQIARHTEVPAVCLGPRRALQRSIPIDTPWHWYEPEQWREAVTWLQDQAMTERVGV